MSPNITKIYIKNKKFLKLFYIREITLNINKYMQTLFKIMMQSF